MAVSNSLLSFIPQTVTDTQQLQLLHQIQGNQMPFFNALILGVLLKFPLPESLFSLQSRLDLFSTLTTTSHSSFLAPIIVLWPVFFILGLISLYFLTKFLISFIKTVFPFVFSKFIKTEPKTFLELTFPSDTSKSAYATQELFNLLHTLSRQQNFRERILRNKKVFSLEIVSSKEQGIRYILVAPAKNADVVKRSILSYLPGIRIKEVDDYLNESINPKSDNQADDQSFDIIELKLSSHFALPLNKQKTLDEHDPISYLTGNMTKLLEGNLIAFQIITTPILNSIHGNVVTKMNDLRRKISQGEPLTPVLNDGTLQKIIAMPVVSLVILPVKIVLAIIKFSVMFIYSMVLAFLDPNSKTIPFLITTSALSNASKQALLNPYEQELQVTVKEKIDQQLFETSIRLLVIAKDQEEIQSRVSGLMASFGLMSSPYQTITTKGSLLPSSMLLKQRLNQFKGRSLSLCFALNQNPILSTSELSDLYHFPYTDITKTEGLVKSRSRELPAPLSLKKSDTNFDVVIGVNQYGGELVPIGITLEQRLKHMYIIGKTGMGKTTLLTSSIYQDMVSGKGLAVFDPHGDMIQEVLRIIPKSRRNDVIFFDPSDREWPIGLNLLSPGITFSNEEDGRDWIASSVLAVFKKLADEKYWGPRMEHILRNACLTALLTPNPNLYTIQRLLTDKKYQKEVALTLKDPVLKQFWLKEFALMGNMQVSSITAPLTQRLGYFISSTMSRHILLQEKSSISISRIMDEGKILLVNLSKGDLGEDQSFFFGTILTSFIWMAAYQRTKIPESKRKDFFLYVDEFQNFATPQFSEITSEGRKFHVSLIASHQNIAQIENKEILKVVAGNANTIVCLKASPDDEQFILPFMDPEVKKGDIVNLAPFNFFMKVTTDDSEDAFSGKTVPVNAEKSDQTKDEVIAYSRKHYSTPRVKVEHDLEKLFAEAPKEISKVKRSTKKPKSAPTKIVKKGV